MRNFKANLIRQKELPELIKKLRKKRKKIVFTNGVFDILHRGHVEYLTKARSQGDVLIVGINSDSSVRQIKGSSRPVNKQNDRAIILLALECVDYVVFFSEITPEKLIKKGKPDVLVKGADYKMNEIVGADFVRSIGGEVKRLPLYKDYSTTGIIRSLRG